MNLADMLSYADIHQLNRIADTYDCECNSNSKNELIQSILSRISRRDVLEQHLRDLSVEDIRFMNSILFDTRNSFSLEELIARVQMTRFEKKEHDGWNPRDMITRFKYKGWLFNGYSQQTKYFFHLPKDLKKRFTDTLTVQFQQHITYLEEPVAYRDEQLLLVEDVRCLLQFLYDQPVTLTSDGWMYKRSLQQILERMAVPEEMQIKTAWRFGYGRKFREYPNRFSLIYDFCYYERWIVENNTVLELTPEGIEALSSRKKVNILALYRFWLRLYKNPIPNLQSLVYWIDRLSAQWTTADSLREAICKLIKPYYYDSAENIFDQRIIRMLMHLGLLRIGEDTSYGMVIAVTKLGSSVIQGTYVAEDDKIELEIDKPQAP